MTDFRFANPNWSIAIWCVLAAVAFMIWLDQRRGNALSRLVSATMQARLVTQAPFLGRLAAILCFGLAAICLVLALMRPQWGLSYVKTPRVGAQIMFCLDVSKSMLAEDSVPNRLERAKTEVSDLLDYLGGDQIGLIAFAGRASVVCPLTPDYGFFRLILDGINENSVTRGGTRLEEPIRKALAGFRDESDVSRVLVLITDGEDHDSKPLDAAKEARDRGIRIMTIGFGDEAGSEIRFTDRLTKQLKTVLDENGKPVISRLDGETLRSIALETEGVYVPAGTGTLDLGAIYDTHIAPLTRGQMDDRGRAVRQDVFQWAILGSLVFLFAGVVLSTGSSAQRRSSEAPSGVGSASRRVARTAGMLLLLAQSWIVFPASIMAADDVDASQNTPVNTTPDSGAGPAAVPAPGEPASDAPSGDSGRSDDEEIDAFSAYNQSVGLVRSDYEQADRLLRLARRDSGIDAEVRFRATYNLGWLTTAQADRKLAEEPEEALALLESAADWFRAAIRLRKDHAESRHNLDIVLRRIIELRDSLLKKDPRDTAARIDELIATQRQITAATRQLTMQVDAADDPNATDQFRNNFRELALQERKLLSDAQLLSDDIFEELETIDEEAEDLPDDQKLRAAQLNNARFYCNRANQRIAQARTQMRMRKADRAFRRATIAVEELKRARDQFRNPVEVLDLLIADATQTAQLTVAKASENQTSLGNLAPTNPSVPKWLDGEYLRDAQQLLSERAQEIVTRLEPATDSDDQPSEPAVQLSPDERKAAEFIAQAREATPMLIDAKEAMLKATSKLAAEDFRGATEDEFTSINLLRDARELFVDVRGLIELIYSGETQIEGAIDPLRDLPPETDLPLDDITTEGIASLAEFAQQQQAKNLSRLARLRTMIEQQLSVAKTQIDKLQADGEQGRPEDQQTLEAQTQLFTAALPLIDQAKQEMTRASDQLKAAKEYRADDAETSSDRPSDDAAADDDAATGDDAATDDDATTGDSKPGAEAASGGLADNVESAMPGATRKDPFEAPFAPARAEVAKAVETIEQLRRMFFSILEHLQETATRQAELGDKTEKLAGTDGDDGKAAESAVLSMQQQDLGNMSQQIAEELKRQAQETPESFAGENDPNVVTPDALGNPITEDPQKLSQSQDTAKSLREASGLVTEAADAMTQVVESLGSETPEFEPARENQNLALEKLIEAIRLLNPDNNDDQQQNQDQQNQDQQQQQQQSQPQEENKEQQADPSRALQQVRDNEARRRKEKDRIRDNMGRAPVAKDW